MPYMNPLIPQYGDERCWLICNPDKTPCTRTGAPMKGWQTTGAKYRQALPFVDGGRVRGLGLRVNGAPNLVALDLDDCLNEAGGIINPVSLLPLIDVPTYIEVTWSGKSLRAYYLLDGKHEPVHLNGHRKGVHQEVYYNTAKFVIVTGNPYHPLPNYEPITELSVITPEKLDEWLAIFNSKRIDDDGSPEQSHDPSAQRRGYKVSASPGGLANFVARQQEGNRNDALFWAANRAFDSGLCHEEVSTLLYDAAMSIGLSDYEVMRTISSAGKTKKNPEAKKTTESRIQKPDRKFYLESGILILDSPKVDS